MCLCKCSSHEARWIERISTTALVLLSSAAAFRRLSHLRHHCHLKNCSKIRARRSLIKALRCKEYPVTFRFFAVAFKTFPQTTVFQKNNSKTLLVPKLLVYPIRQGIWMSVLRTRHGGVMKAITHCQGRWAPPNTHLQTWVSYLF